MNFRKFSLVLTALILIVTMTACGNKQAIQQKLSSQEIINKVNKNQIKSYHINQKMTYHIDTKTQTMHQNLLCGGKPIVVHANQSQNSQYAETWLNDKYEYIKENNTWFKVKLKKATQAATAVSQRMKSSNNVLANNPKMAKVAKLKTTSKNYILTIKNNKHTNAAILKTTREALDRLGTRSNYKQIAQHLKITHYNLVETINRKTFQIKKVTCNIKMKVEDQMTIETTQVLDRIDQYPKLQIPTSITKKVKKMSINQLSK